MTKYYLDACIWLNLLNKEQTKIQGLPVWKITELFLIQYTNDIICSRFVRKEVLNKSKAQEKILLLDKFKELNITTEEMALARELESKEQYHLSFFDCIHLATCIKRNYTLITRDQELLDRGKQYITTRKPEELLY